MAMNKDVNKIIRRARKDGWNVHRTGHHIRLIPPSRDADMVVVSAGSLGSAKAFKAFRSSMRRSGFDC